MTKCRISVRSSRRITTGLALFVIGLGCGTKDPEALQQPKTRPGPIPELSPAPDDDDDDDEGHDEVISRPSEDPPDAGFIDLPDGGREPVAMPPTPAICRIEPRDDYEPELRVFDLLVELEDWDTLHEDVEADIEVDAAVCIDGVRYPIELELQGASTRLEDKKSFDLKFNRGRALPGTIFEDGEDGGPIEKLFLKAMAGDQSLIREAVSFDLIAALGKDAPRKGYANLRINGDYWGLYALTEPIDQAFLDRRGYPKGTLYKGVRKHGSFADFAPGRDLGAAFENQEIEDPAEWHDLVALVDTLQHTPLDEASYQQQIDPIFSLETYFERMAWISFTQNGDAVRQNFFLHNGPRDGHDHWTQLPWDSDLCCSADWRGPDRVLPPDQSLNLDGGNYFSQRMLRIESLKARYHARLRELLDSVLTTEHASRLARDYSDYIHHDLALDQERWQRGIGPEEALGVVLDFFAARPDVLRAALDAEERGEEHESEDAGVDTGP